MDIAKKKKRFVEEEEEAEKNRNILIYPLHCTKCKMRNEKEKLFRRYLQGATSMFASHIKFIYFVGFFQTIKHFSIVISSRSHILVGLMLLKIENSLISVNRSSFKISAKADGNDRPPVSD
jgi:hypothetical protein